MAGPDAGRTDQPLGPDLAAHGSLRFQAEVARRAGRSTGRSPTTTWRPTTTRPKCWSASTAATKAWRTRRDSSPGVLLPPPTPRGTNCSPRNVRPAGDSGDSGHLAILTTGRMPAPSEKLHPGNPLAQRVLAESMRSRQACFWATRLRPGLLDQGQLSVHHGAAAAGAGHRQLRHRPRRDGARSHHRQDAAGHRRELHRQAHPHRPARRARGGGAGGERLRDRAHSAQLEEHAFPTGSPTAAAWSANT